VAVGEPAGAHGGDDQVAGPDRAAFGDVSAWVGADLVGTAQIGRPPDNFFDADLIASLADSYSWLDGQGARAIVLCSEGKNFCAGADLAASSSRARPLHADGPAELYTQAVRLFEVPIPVVAAVQGAAVGGGLGLACSADFRVAGPRARFCANFTRLGLHHGFGLTVTLPELVGRQRAIDLLYTARQVGTDEAARIGLADRVTEDASARAGAQELAAQLAQGGPLAMRSVRATMRAGLAGRVAASMQAELAEQRLLWPTADFAEGVRASAERRPPRFQGR
jgi:2-(1,2-epoxy-1,2-dihydrophenyl)acetyl-CoA isomerase